MLGSQFIAGLIAKACDQRMNMLRESSDNVVKQQLASKSFELEYEKFEKQETRDALRRANVSAMGMGGIGDHIMDLYRLAEYTFAIIYSIIFTVILFLQVDNKNTNFFTSYWLTIVLILIYPGTIFIYGIGSKKVIQIFNNMSKNNDSVNSNGNYMGSLIMNQKNAKDIRIFKLQETLIGRQKGFWEIGLSCYLKAGKTTLIKLLCRLYEPTSGYITLNGVDTPNFVKNNYGHVGRDFITNIPKNEEIITRYSEILKGLQR